MSGGVIGVVGVEGVGDFWWSGEEVDKILQGAALPRPRRLLYPIDNSCAFSNPMSPVDPRGSSSTSFKL